MTNERLLRQPWMSEVRDAVGARVLVRGLLVVVLLNALFLLLLVATLGDPGVVRTRVQAAFRAGDLGFDDFPPFDSRRGFLQYSDCIVLQMLAAPDSSRLRRAISPLVYIANTDWRGQCAVLHRVAGDDTARRGLLERRYSRYWHGYNAAVAVGLRVMEIRTLRRVLVAGVWVALAALMFSMWRAGEASRRVAAAIGLAASLFWALPYFAPSFTSGFGDAALLLGLAVLAGRPLLAVQMSSIVPYAAGFGAVIVFFEMLTGQLPVAAAWLIACIVAARHDRARAPRSDVRALAAAAIIAFAVGAVLTVTIKQFLALASFDPGAGDAFFSRLRAYADTPDAPAGRPGILLPFVRLVQRADVLTYGSRGAGYALVGVIAVSWVVGAVRAWRDRGVEGNVNRLVLLAAALMPLFWVLVLPKHTSIHAVFMVRILVASIALAPLAALWPVTRESPD